MAGTIVNWTHRSNRGNASLKQIDGWTQLHRGWYITAPIDCWLPDSYGCRYVNAKHDSLPVHSFFQKKKIM